MLNIVISSVILTIVSLICFWFFKTYTQISEINVKYENFDTKIGAGHAIYNSIEDDDLEYVIEISDEEIEMLCYVVQAEVGNCSYEHKMWVTRTVINRVISDRFPDNVHDVLTQQNQYSSIKNYYNKTNQPNNDTVSAVNETLKTEHDFSNGSIYFYSPVYITGKTSSWFESMIFTGEFVEVISGTTYIHRFFR